MTWTLKLLVTNRSIRMLSQPCPRLVLGMLIRRKLEDAEKGACYSFGLPNFASNTNQMQIRDAQREIHC